MNRYYVHVGGDRIEAEIQGREVRIGGEPVDVALLPGSSHTPWRTVRLGDRSVRVLPVRTGQGRWAFAIDGVTYPCEVLDPGDEAVRSARSAVAATKGPAPLKAPMPGMVVRVEVAVGDVVEAGQGIVIVEAMKMENELKAPAPGRVTAIHTEAGTPVEKDSLLVEFEPLEEDE